MREEAAWAWPGEVITELSSTLQRAEAGPRPRPEGWGDQLQEGEGREEGGGPGRRWDEGDLFLGCWKLEPVCS